MERLVWEMSQPLLPYPCERTRSKHIGDMLADDQNSIAQSKTLARVIVNCRVESGMADGHA